MDEDYVCSCGCKLWVITDCSRLICGDCGRFYHFGVSSPAEFNRTREYAGGIGYDPAWRDDGLGGKPTEAHKKIAERQQMPRGPLTTELTIGCLRFEVALLSREVDRLRDANEELRTRLSEGDE